MNGVCHELGSRDIKAKCKKFTNEEFLTGLGLIIGSAEFSQKGVDLFGTKKMMIMNFISGPQSVPAHSLSSLWPSAISKTFEGFCPVYLQMKARKRVIPGGSFQVLLNNLILLGLVKLTAHLGYVLMRVCVPGNQG